MTADMSDEEDEDGNPRPRCRMRCLYQDMSATGRTIYCIICEEITSTICLLNVICQGLQCCSGDMYDICVYIKEQSSQMRTK